MAKAIIVCGLTFGDEGKGTITDALARRHGATTVVRYNGGPQAGHNVVTPDGVWHCFAQFGAASFLPGVRTILSRHMLINPDNMGIEAEVLEQKGIVDMFGRLIVDPRCPVITPAQKAVGRMREIVRGDRRLGSCGQGVGETVCDRERGIGIVVRDMVDGSVDTKLRQLMLRKAQDAIALGRPNVPASLEEAFAADRAYRTIVEPPPFTVEDAEEALRRAFSEATPVIFEGAQGALLDRTRGTVPHVTQSDTTCRNAVRLIDDAIGIENCNVARLGIVRAYGHRHGAGPLDSEDASLRSRFDDPYNRENPWQGPFRVGWLNLADVASGIRMNGGVDGLAVTCLDQLTGLAEIPVVIDDEGTRWTLPGWHEDLAGITRFDDLPLTARAYVQLIEQAMQTPVLIVSVGPRADQKIFR
jgi:adenylosuccinate synthase